MQVMPRDQALKPSTRLVMKNITLVKRPTERDVLWYIFRTSAKMPLGDLGLLITGMP